MKPYPRHCKFVFGNLEIIETNYNDIIGFVGVVVKDVVEDDVEYVVVIVDVDVDDVFTIRPMLLACATKRLLDGRQDTVARVVRRTSRRRRWRRRCKRRRKRRRKIKRRKEQNPVEEEEQISRVVL